MANVLSDLAADIYVAADRVSRELTGFIPAVTINPSTARAALNDTVRSAVTQASTVVNRTQAMTISEGTDQTVGNQTLTINKDRAVEIPWTGEDIKHVNNGAGFETIYGDQIMQAMRALANEMETDLANAAYLGSSRATGTAGTTPFGTAGNLTDASLAQKILEDNGAPLTDQQLVINTSAGANFTGLQTQYNVSGVPVFANQGILNSIPGMSIRKSGQIVTHAAGTASGATTDNAGYAIGATTITLASAGTGTLLAGDVITFAGDTNKYVVVTGDADVSGGGTVVLQEPGLRQAIPASATAITVTAASARNIAFARSAIELAARMPATPVINGVIRDAAIDRMEIVDPVSRLPFEVAAYVGQGKAMMQVACAWGVKTWKPQHVATLLG